jgi:uncharacterized protein YaiI (UPF0178 family)
MVCSLSHYSDFNDGVQHIIVDNIPQAADMAIINRVQKGDIVVTQDYGLAALILDKGGYALHHTGKIYSGDNIEHLLFKRHLAGKIRRSGGRTQGPKAFTKQDKENFRNALQNLVLKLKAGINTRDGEIF